MNKLFNPDNVKYLIETERLYIVPLLPEQLTSLSRSATSFKDNYGIDYQAEPTDGFFGQLLLIAAKNCQTEYDKYPFNTFWLIVKKTDATAVGSIDYKNYPFPSGTVEIGYGLGDCHTGKGYMTETVAAFCRNAFSSGIKTVEAYAEKENVPSQNVLLRCGFKKIGENEAGQLRFELNR